MFYYESENINYKKFSTLKIFLFLKFLTLIFEIITVSPGQMSSIKKMANLVSS